LIGENGGYTKEELSAHKFLVYGNIITQMKLLCSSAIQLATQLDSEENQRRAERLVDTSPGGDTWTLELARDIHHLWKDSGIQKIFHLAPSEREAQLNDSTLYFFDSLERIMVSTYVPTVLDLLRTRVRSTGIEETTFSHQEVHFRMIDVGGQRSERRKWIHVFDRVTAVIFCVAISEYDQVLREDHQTNRLQESLNLFEEIFNCSYFRKCKFFLLLNKEDLFEEKIQKVDLNVCFPNYTGGLNAQAAKTFIAARFSEKATDQKDRLHYFFTVALDTQTIDKVFAQIRETLHPNSNQITHSTSFILD